MKMENEKKKKDFSDRGWEPAGPDMQSVEWLLNVP